jgi:hypothetical protein
VSKVYEVLPPAPVAGVEPGGRVTREQVEAWGGPRAHIVFDVLVGTHLKEVADEPEPAPAKTTKATK